MHHILLANILRNTNTYPPKQIKVDKYDITENTAFQHDAA